MTTRALRMVAGRAAFVLSMALVVPCRGLAQRESRVAAENPQAQPAAPPARAEGAGGYDDTDHLLTLLQRAVTALNENRPADARPALDELLSRNREPWVHVFIAASWCADGDADKAFEELDRAISAFEVDPWSASPLACNLAQDLLGEDWQSLREDPRFEPLLARAKKAAWRPEPVAFDESPGSEGPRSRRHPTDSREARELADAYALFSVIAGATSDLERVRRMCHWVHGRTGHQGWNDALPDDALGLLKVADSGVAWRCVEYGTVLAGCLNAVGIPARVVGGQARDVETTLAGAGHVFAEAWLDDVGRWVFVDPQLDIVAVDTDGTPLNSVQFRATLARPEPPFDYPRGLAFCLHFFNYGDLEGGKRLMLGPVGSRMPVAFQRRSTRLPDVYTHRTTDAYQPPRGGAARRTTARDGSP